MTSGESECSGGNSDFNPSGLRLRRVHGLAFAAGWNDVCKNIGWRQDYEIEFNDYAISYEMGRAYATCARSCLLPLKLWDGRVYSRWHPHVLWVVSQMVHKMDLNTVWPQVPAAPRSQ